MAKSKVLLDSNCLINWLAKEVDEASGIAFWKSSYQIALLAENEEIDAYIALTTLMEVRFVLRRKKRIPLNLVEKDIATLRELFHTIVPDELRILHAESLQRDEPLGPFDALLLSIALAIEDVIIITRDKQFFSVARKYLPTHTPESFLESITGKK